MAALSADAPFVFDPSRNIGLRQVRAAGADTFFRGALSGYTAGELDVTPAETVPFAGIVAQNTVVAAQGDLVWVATAGRFHFACTNFTLANMEVAFAAQTAGLTDNPADLDVSGAADAAVAGVLDQVTVTAISGWLDISRRLAGTNA